MIGSNAVEQKSRVTIITHTCTTLTSETNHVNGTIVSSQLCHGQRWCIVVVTMIERIMQVIRIGVGCAVRRVRGWKGHRSFVWRFGRRGSSCLTFPLTSLFSFTLSFKGDNCYSFFIGVLGGTNKNQYVIIHPPPVNFLRQITANNSKHHASTRNSPSPRSHRRNINR